MAIQIKALPKGTAFTRVSCAFALSGGRRDAARQFVEGRFRDTPGVGLIVDEVEPMSTDNSSALVRYGVSQDFIEALTGVSIFENLKPYMRRVSFDEFRKRDTVGASASWVAEGTPIPAVPLNFDDGVLLPPYQMGVMCVLSQELARFSRPGAEDVCRRIFATAIARFVDQQLLDPGLSAVARTNPASITAAATVASYLPVPLSHASRVSGILSAICDQLQSWVSPVWLMTPAIFSHVAAYCGASLVYAGGKPFLMGFPVVHSANSPNQLCLVDANDIFYADDGEVGVSASRQADFDMVVDENSPPTTERRSLLQHNLVAVRLMRRLSWSVGHSGSCVIFPAPFSE
jgi:HK97 family phage major capsid protein